MKWSKYILVIGLALMWIVALPASAQDRTIITVTSPPWMSYVLDSDDLVRKFEESFPGATFVYIPGDEETMNLGSITYETEPEDYFDKLETYFSTADVVYIGRWFFGPEATAAGYALNLVPLVETDPTLKIDDYYRAVWEYYQWDRGMWAVPTTGQVRFTLYEANAFDRAGASYPNANWTLQDFANAVRTLTQRDADGNLTMPGWIPSIQTAILLRALLGTGFADESQIPAPPHLNTPEIAALVEQWQAMNDEGLLNMYEFSGDWNTIPLRFEGVYMLDQNNRDWQDEQGLRFAAAMLPGDTAELYTDGFAVSAGTQNPELAYQLARFLSEEVGWQFGGEPARRNQTTDPNMYQPSLTPDDAAFVDRARDNALTGGDLRYADYIEKALQKMIEEDIDAQTALDAVQAEAMTNFQMALERASTTRIEVAPPPDPVVLAPGEIALTFGLDLYGPVIQNRSQWDQVVAEFVASEPGVGHMKLDTNYWGPDGIEADCYFQMYNQLQNPEVDLTQLRSLDPFIDADPNFDPNDFIGSALAQAQRNDQTWGYPITLQPLVLMYEKETFRSAGVPFPRNDWTLDEFIYTLDTLNVSLGEDRVGFMVGGGNTEFLILVAAYGGLPIDYRTEPPTLNFTEPDTVEAIRQVLELAKKGTLGYGAMTPLGYELTQPSTDYRQPAMFASSLSAYNFGFRPVDEEFQMGFVPFPRGSRYQGALVDVGMVYISSNSQNPEVCYRWISAIAQHPELFPGMPARRSQLSNPAVTTIMGEDVSAIYQTLADMLNSSHTIPFRYGSSGPAGYAEQTWLNQVFDRYVLGSESFDLAAELAKAQDYSLAFRDCAAAIPPYDPEEMDTPEESEAYYRQFDDCAKRIDPDWRSMFSPQEG